MELEDVSTQDEAELVRAAQQGDALAFGELVRRHQNTVCGIAYALTGRLSMSEDVAQEAFLLAWRDLASLREPVRFRSWLMAVTRRASGMALRKDRTVSLEMGSAALTDRLPAVDPSPLESVINREEERAIWSALEKIPEGYRVPLVLFYREQQSLETVAAMLDTTEGNVRVRLVRGRRLLQRHLMGLLESALARGRAGKEVTGAVVAAALFLGPHRRRGALRRQRARIRAVSDRAAQDN